MNRLLRASIVMLVGAIAICLVSPGPVMGEARQLGSLAMLNAAVEAMEWEAEDAGVQRRINQAGQRAVNQGLGLLSTGMKLYHASRGFTEADAALSEVLNPDDNEFNPDYTPDGAPTVPVHCEVEGGAECQECYLSAYKKLNFVRFYLERLRGIYGATRNYTKNAIAFGDSMATLPGGFGLGWPPERKRIQDAFTKLGGTYDKKYEEYMLELRGGLQDVAACEKQYFGEDDWYSRYGFIYYSFLADRYRR